MLDACACGSGDWKMAFGLVARSSGCRELKSSHPNYASAIRAWQERAKSLRMDIGCIDHLALHRWHGTLQHRGYGSRVSILVDNAYDPLTDVVYDGQVVLRLTGNKPQLRDGAASLFSIATKIPWNLRSRTRWGSSSLNKHSHYSDPAETLTGQAVK